MASFEDRMKSWPWGKCRRGIMLRARCGGLGQDQCWHLVVAAERRMPPRKSTMQKRPLMSFCNLSSCGTRGGRDSPGAGSPWSDNGIPALASHDR